MHLVPTDAVRIALLSSEGEVQASSVVKACLAISSVAFCAAAILTMPEGRRRDPPWHDVLGEAVVDLARAAVDVVAPPSPEPPPLPHAPQIVVMEPRCDLRPSDEQQPITICGTPGAAPLCDELILGVRRQSAMAFSLEDRLVWSDGE